MGAVGALAPTVFLPRPEIIHISVYLFFCPAPKLYLYLHPHYLVQFGAGDHMYKNRVGAAIERILFDLYSFI